MKRFWSMVLALCLCLSCTVAAEDAPYYIYDTESGETAQTLLEDMAVVADPSALSVNAKSAVLMDMASGTVLFEQNSHEALPIASVTKVMTLLLVMEAIDGGNIALSDTVTASARAASMGGSQIWLEENEQMTVEELLKAAVIVSANDACAALAEHISGTIEAFVAQMNERAAQLGASNTHFVDCSGLDDTGVSSAHDLALMSRELMMKHPTIQNYTTVWMDSLRGGQSELVNTNRLVRFYNGATGLKTGTTAAAGCCLAATARRDGLPLCAVVLGAPSSNDRFTGARNLLDYGFASYALYTPPVESLSCDPIRVLHGTAQEVAITPPEVAGIPVEKAQVSKIEVRLDVAEDLEAPVEAGQTVGEVIVLAADKELMRVPLTAAQAVEKMTWTRAFARFFTALTAGIGG